MKKLKLFLLAAFTVSSSGAEAGSAGIVHYKLNGTNDYVKDYADTGESAQFTTCSGAKKTKQKSEIEFLEQPDVCAKLSLKEYETFLQKAQLAAKSMSAVEEVSVQIPPEQDFAAAAEMAKKAFDGFKLKTESSRNLKVTIKGTFANKSTPNFAASWSDTQGPVLVDKSGMIELKAKGP